MSPNFLLHLNCLHLDLATWSLILFESSVPFQLPSEFSNEDICPDGRSEVKRGEYIIINACKMVSVPIAIIKHLAQSILGEERFMLAQNLTKHSPPWWGRHGSRNLMQMLTSQLQSRSKRTTGSGICLSNLKVYPSDLLPPVRLLLKVL